MFRSRLGLTLLLAIVFVVNLAETQAEQFWSQSQGSEFVARRDYRFAYAMKGLERYLSIEKFENHDAANPVAVYGYSISYFFFLPMLAFGVALALMLREDIQAYRVLCFSVAIDYLITVLFFIGMPVPERWSFPDSGAILLSDLWSSKLIEQLRPISGLDNCFPSTHVSFTVILILVCYIFRVRMRTTVLMLGLTIIFSTFVLGIHWVPDMVAGGGVAWLSVVLAQRLDVN